MLATRHMESLVRVRFTWKIWDHREKRWEREKDHKCILFSCSSLCTMTTCVLLAEMTGVVRYSLPSIFFYSITHVICFGERRVHVYACTFTRTLSYLCVCVQYIPNISHQWNILWICFVVLYLFKKCYYVYLPGRQEGMLAIVRTFFTWSFHEWNI